MDVLGIIAGSGGFPIKICDELKQRGDICVVAALEEADLPPLKKQADSIRIFRLGDLGSVVAFFQEQGVKKAVFAGKIEHRSVLVPGALSPEAMSLLQQLPDLNPETILKALVDYFSARGIRIIQPDEFIKPLICVPGILSRTRPTAAVKEDIDFGWDRARRLADMDIGQTLVVKARAVVAVEGMEGTDETIRRAGELAGPGVVVIKLGRTHQDLRIDLPAVGLGTIEASVEASAAALCFEAAVLPFFQKQEALRKADENGLVIMAL